MACSEGPAVIRVGDAMAAEDGWNPTNRPQCPACWENGDPARQGPDEGCTTLCRFLGACYPFGED